MTAVAASRRATLRAVLLLSGLGVALVVAEVAVRVASARVVWYDVEMWKYARTLKRVSDVSTIGHEHWRTVRRGSWASW